MGSMFEGANAFSQDISSWDASSVGLCSDFATGVGGFFIPNFPPSSDCGGS
jgi:hypothetical protein